MHKLSAPPDKLAEALRRLAQNEDFITLPSLGS